MEAYQEFYAGSAFTHISNRELDLKQVVNTNKCLLSLQVEKGQLVVYSAIDNLLKGASGQAVQNFNLAFGLDEKMGLNLKSIAF
jgi:N-acetyl-gamma-glutamyl-phosphate reductase